MKTFLFLFLLLTSIIFPQGIYFSEPLSSSVYYSGGGSIAIPYNMYHSSSIVVYDYYAALLPNGGSWTAWQYGEIGGWYIAKSGTTYIKGKAWVQNLFGGSPYWAYRDPFSFSTIDNNSPSIPQNPALSNSGGYVQFSWTANTEMDLQYYEVWRKVTEINNNWYLIATPTNSYFIDDEYYYTYPVGDFHLYYKVRAKDINGNYSSYSSEVSTRGEFTGKQFVAGEELIDFSLNQNYPNPFNPSTQITYVIPEESKVQIKVYDMLGTEIAELVNEIKTAGYYETTFNASYLSSGVYVYRITAIKGDKIVFSQAKQMILLQ